MIKWMIYGFCFFSNCCILHSQNNPCHPILIPSDSIGIFSFSGYNAKKGLIDSLCLQVPIEYSFAVKLPKTKFVLPIGNSLQNLPSTLKYFCYPVDCTFKEGEIGCITLKGKLDNSFEFQALNLKLKVPDSLGYQLNDFGFFLRPISNTVCKTSSTQILGATKLKMNAYPNPFTDKIQINIQTELSGLFDLLLYQIDGKLVERRRINLNPGNNRFEFPVNDVPSGIFSCSLTDGFSTVSIRLSKQ